MLRSKTVVVFWLWCVYAMFPRGKAGVVYSACSWFESPAVFAGYDISLFLNAIRIHIHLSCAHQRPERSHDTNQLKYNITCTCKAQSYQNNLHYYIEKRTHSRTHRPTHTHTQTHTHSLTHSLTLSDCSRNRVLILAGAEILWEEEGFQFGFKSWQGWAVSKVLWEWILDVGSKARESAKAMSLAFVLLDFEHAGVRRRA